MAKHLALILLVVYLFILTWLSFIDIGGLPSLGSSFDDKIFHALSHALLTYLFYNYFKKTTIAKPVLLSVLIPIIYGVTIEWLQGFTSNLRTADAYDVLANFLGTVFAVIFITLVKNVKLN